MEKNSGCTRISQRSREELQTYRIFRSHSTNNCTTGTNKKKTQGDAAKAKETTNRNIRRFRRIFPRLHGCESFRSCARMHKICSCSSEIADVRGRYCFSDFADGSNTENNHGSVPAKSLRKPVNSTVSASSLMAVVQIKKKN